MAHGSGLNSLKVLLPLALDGCSRSSALRMALLSGTRLRLVAQGFSQQPGWDFVENFAPTIRLSVIRTIFALVAAEDKECDSLDITTAFLNGELEDNLHEASTYV